MKAILDSNAAGVDVFAAVAVVVVGMSSEWAENSADGCGGPG